MMNEWMNNIKHWCNDTLCGNSGRKKPCSRHTLCSTNPTWTVHELKPGLRGKRPATNRMNHGTSKFTSTGTKMEYVRGWCIMRRYIVCTLHKRWHVRGKINDIALIILPIFNHNLSDNAVIKRIFPMYHPEQPFQLRLWQPFSLPHVLLCA